MAVRECDEMEDVRRAAVEFDRRRAHLRSIAVRMLGSTTDADDAVQETWLRLSRTDTAQIGNLGGWLTTAVSRVCLDRLRSRRSRGEQPLSAAAPRHVTDDDLGPEEQAALNDMVAGALYVVLDRLSPLERIAFVLHDLFGVSFEEIGRTVDRTSAAARQLASRARRRIRGADIGGLVDRERQRQVLEAFLRAARQGDIDGLLEVLAPDIVLVSDHAATALDGVPARVEGATDVASTFSGRAQNARTALIDGDLGIAVQMGQRTVLLLHVTMNRRQVTAIEAMGDPDRLAAIRVVFLAP